jgi:multidrug efflux pump
MGTLLTLLFLPALYVAWFRISEEPKDVRPVTACESMPLVSSPELTLG